MRLRRKSSKMGNHIACISLAASVFLSAIAPANANDFWRYNQARYVGTESASAMLRLNIPLGGATTVVEDSTLGLSLAAASSRYSAGQVDDRFTANFRGMLTQSPALTETPFFQTGITLQGKYFTKLNYVHMGPVTADRAEFFDGDMDGGEIFIFGAVIGAALYAL